MCILLYVSHTSTKLLKTITELESGREIIQGSSQIPICLKVWKPNVGTPVAPPKRSLASDQMACPDCPVSSPCEILAFCRLSRWANSWQSWSCYYKLALLYGLLCAFRKSCSLLPKACSPQESARAGVCTEWEGKRGGLWDFSVLGASESGQYNLVSKQNVSLLFKVKSCAEFLSLSKARIVEYEKEVSDPWPLSVIGPLSLSRPHSFHPVAVTYLGFVSVSLWPSLPSPNCPLSSWRRWRI